MCLLLNSFHRPNFGGSLLMSADAEFNEFVTRDETLFDKHMNAINAGPLALIAKYATGEGLFTNGSEMHSWELAHRILLPAFSMKGMKSYFPTLLKQMNRLLGQLETMEKANHEIDITDLMTRMTLDSIGAAGFDFEFSMIDNKEDPNFIHPFVHVRNVIFILFNSNEVIFMDLHYLKGYGHSSWRSAKI